MNFTRPSVAAEVRAAMARADLTQTELAAKLSISRAALSDRMIGKRPFTIDDLHEIGAALGVDPMIFLLPPGRQAAAS